MLAGVVEEFVSTVSGLGRSSGCLGPWSGITRISLNGVQVPDGDCQAPFSAPDVIVCALW